ncbi:MAG TPA: hypothetical protein VFY06_04220 [Verrucomicrobiae bacterium]|nr:hypothetical protein [Verrucomicrobiae bacterium]
MKPTRYKIGMALALVLATGFYAVGQSNRVPGPTDYAQFSQFITQRNIFNPDRYAVSAPPVHTTPQPPRFTPSFTLCGIMSYEKGVFAFFDGNEPDLQKVLYPSGSNTIAVFTVADITATNVMLQSSNSQQTVALNIGEGMRLEGNNWQKIEQGGFFGGGGSSGFGGRNGGGGGRFDRGNFGDGNRFNYYNGGGAGRESSSTPAYQSSSPDASTGSSGTTSSSSGSSALEQNDVLKKLMQQRQQELQ